MLSGDPKPVFRATLMQALLVRHYEPAEQVPVTLCKLVAQLNAQDDDQ
jgi:hypothetical protein